MHVSYLPLSGEGHVLGKGNLESRCFGCREKVPHMSRKALSDVYGRDESWAPPVLTFFYEQVMKHPGVKSAVLCDIDAVVIEQSRIHLKVIHALRRRIWHTSDSPDWILALASGQTAETLF